MTFLQWLWISGMLLGTMRCTSLHYTGDTGNKLYPTLSTTLEPDYFVYNPAADVSELWFFIKSDQLLYTKNKQNAPFIAEVKIRYRVYNNFRDKVLIDSATHRVRDMDNNRLKKDLIGKIPLKLKGHSVGVIQITTFDVKRKTEQTRTLPIHVSNVNRQAFRVHIKGATVPLFRPYLPAGTAVEVTHRSNPEKLFGRIYRRNFPPAAPPFSTFGNPSFGSRADSLFELEKDAKGGFRFQLPAKGFIHIQSDTSTQTGVTLFVTHPDFPNVTTHNRMIESLRYITSKKEFKNITAQQNPKVAVEKFWIECAGNKARASEVIRKYYNRVQASNRYFTSYVEGWKTDRGLVYIIFGPPATVYRHNKSEVWVYGKEHYINSMMFNFRRMNNPFSDNDYALERNPSLKNNWYRAVSDWRKGRAFVHY